MAYTRAKKAYFDVAARIKAVELRDQLQHRALHFVRRALGVACRSRATDSVDFVEEDYARLLRARHGEDLADEARTLAYIPLNEFRADDANKGCIGSVRNRSCAKRLA